MKYWGRWLQSTAGFDGFRLDAVKHIDADYLREWVGDVRAAAGRPLFCFGEWLSSDVRQLHGFVERLSTTHPYPQDVSLLDFPLRFQFKDASYAGDTYDLSRWNRQTCRFPARAGP